MATHLVQKPGESTWYVRMAVPADVRHAFGGRTKLIKTTGTSNRAEAMNRRLPILAEWKADIAAARSSSKVNREGWQEKVFVKAGDHRARADAALIEAIRNPPKGSANPTIESVRQKTAQLEYEQALLLDQVKQHERETGATGLSARIEAHFNSPAESMAAGVQFADELTRNFIAEAARTKYSLSTLEQREAHTIIINPEKYKPTSPITDNILDRFRTHRAKDGIADKTIDQQESKLKKLSVYLRDTGLRLNHGTISAWLDTFSLTSKTKAQYLLAGSTFWQWAMKSDSYWKELHQDQDNPFKEQELPKVRGKAKVEAARKAFTPEQIESLYRVAKAQNNQTLCDLIMLGAHTGCRIEELAQLRKESVVKVEGILSFKIDDSKTAAGIREIPVHPAIKTTVERLTAESADGFLLPASTGNQYGIRSDSLSKAFGRMKTSEGYGKQHVFHSVRKMVVTLLLRANVPGPTVANIVGHETGLVTFDVYDEGASPQQKFDALCKLTFNL